MATHYNEPVDIASSSLTEQGTVYGGSANLKKGLKNLIELYHPDVIGVMTTCLAETIGEDVPGIIDDFYEIRNTGTFISFPANHRDMAEVSMKDILKRCMPLFCP